MFLAELHSSPILDCHIFLVDLPPLCQNKILSSVLFNFCHTVEPLWWYRSRALEDLPVCWLWSKELFCYESGLQGFSGWSFSFFSVSYQVRRPGIQWCLLESDFLHDSGGSLVIKSGSWSISSGSCPRVFCWNCQWF